MLTCTLNDAQGGFDWRLVDLKLYVETAPGSVTIFIFSRCRVSFEIPGWIDETIMSQIKIAPPYIPTYSGNDISIYGDWKPDTVTSAHTSSEMVFQGPGRGDLEAYGETILIAKQFGASTAFITADLAFSHGERPVTVIGELPWKEQRAVAGKTVAIWSSWNSE